MQSESIWLLRADVIKSANSGKSGGQSHTDTAGLKWQTHQGVGSGLDWAACGGFLDVLSFVLSAAKA